MNSLKITVIGCGNVGNAVATILLNRSNHAIELNVMEPSVEQTGRLIELQHIVGLFQIHRFTHNDLEEFRNADVVFHTAGKCMNANETRLDVVEGNLKLTHDIFKQVSFKHEPYVIVLTNPVDVLTYFVQKQTKLPRNKVIGTGTLLDSARFNAALKKYTIISQNVPAWVVGEHGDSMVLLYSNLLAEHDLSDKELIKKVTHDTVFAAKLIKEYQGYTSTGVASVAVHIMDYLLGGESVSKAFPVSCVVDDALQNKLGLKRPIALSWFFDIQHEAKSVYPIELSELEWSQLKKSAQLIENIIHKIQPD